MGGPIKEGIMHGIREPYAGGQLVRPGPGRPGYAGEETFWSKLAAQYNPKNFASPKKFIQRINPFKKWKTATKVAPLVTKGVKDLRGIFVRKPPSSGITSSGAGQGFVKNLKDFSLPYGSKLKGWATRAKDLAIKYPKTTIAGGVGLTSDPARSVYSNLGGMGRWTAEALLPGWAERKFLPWRGTKLGKDGQTTTPFHPSQGNVKEEIEEKIIEPEKSDAEIRKEQIQKYRDIMDIKGMNKEAAYNSLIEASRLVNESGDFKGDMRSGKLINQMIQGASKAFDKPKATKDAIDTLILKGEIEKDLNKDKNAILDTYRMKQIENLDRAAAQDSLQGDIRTYVTKQGALPSGNMLANFARGRGWNITGVEDTTEVKKWMNNNDGKNEIDYLTWVMSEGEIGPGVYVINNRILEVDEQKKITPKF